MRIAAAAVGLLLAASALAAWRLEPAVRIGAGFKAKMACSEAFVAGRDDADILATEFAGVDASLDFIPLRIDRTRRETLAGVGPLGRSRAVYREGLGCTLVEGKLAAVASPAPVEASDWPTASPTEAGFIAAELDAAIEAAMADTGPGHRAFLVARDGALVAERYADGFAATTPMLSWSMAKSVTATMIAIAAHDGLIDLDAAPPIAAWSSHADDPRRAITWRDLLQMQSGLEFGEIYDSVASDVNRMLFASPSVADAAIQKPLIHAPGDHWDYSSGTTNILQRALRVALEGAGVDYHLFARDRLFAPLGLSSAVLEPDAVGDFIGSSFMYATARDWAKIGQLYLQDGVWAGERMLPEGWVSFAATPADRSDKQYGAQLWLNAAGADGRAPFMPDLPENAYMFAGHEGQYVVILPDEEIIFVRLGRTREGVPMEIAGAAFGAMLRTLTARDGSTAEAVGDDVR